MFVKGDLHLHSCLSDGSASLEQLYALAADKGLSYLAVTDHDFIPHICREVELSEQYGVKTIRGVEISSIDTERKRKVHVLCYLPQDTAELEQICQLTTQNRMAAGVEMANQVTQKYTVTIADIMEKAKQSNSIFKQHIMQALMDAGYTNERYGVLFHTLFNSKTGSCIVKYQQPDVRDVIAAVKRSGGVCVMAHPHTYNGIDFLHGALEERLFDGIEVWSSKSNQQQEEYLLALCKNHHLIPTGGSDFHGVYSAKDCSVGIKTTPECAIQAILDLKEVRK